MRLSTEVLAEVYVELTGKRQARLSLVEEPIAVTPVGMIAVVRVRPSPLLPRISDAERRAHLAIAATLGERAIWNEYLAALRDPLSAEGCLGQARTALYRRYPMPRRA